MDGDDEPRLRALLQVARIISAEQPATPGTVRLFIAAYEVIDEQEAGADTASGPGTPLECLHGTDLVEFVRQLERRRFRDPIPDEVLGVLTDGELRRLVRALRWRRGQFC